ncbi:cyclic nucleotide-degrading phosphodiesterase [Williamsia sterculiae]|uniref:Ribonuclease BN, tRNA processing enzyme n=1 Tax=Williamsia sterculiae TaxID=1344003 RepID=A0A1N7HG22_9NOCA|nr:cyclic nucleotide-degrading phosphodiesterase [Williamsia sterculiae]SIS23742.1 Ribonuclease BN, tRNA processing enzyme [Williamsia sterculiae]
MRLTVLGCSGSVGGPGNPCSGYLLRVPGERPVVMDFGPGVLGALQRHVDPIDVDVILSHLHADHCLDLPGLLVWRRYAPTPATDRAALYGPPGTAQRIGAASSEFPGEIDDVSDTFDVLPWVDGQQVRLGGMAILPRTVAHPPSTVGLRITGPEGEVLAFSGDSGVCDTLVELASDADVFLCEASWTHAPGQRPPHLHLSGTEAGQMAARAHVKSLAITHIPPWTSTEDVLDEVRAEYDGPISVVNPDTELDVG